MFIITPMTLDQYLIENELTNAAFGAIIGVSSETVRRYRNGERWPDRDQWKIIIDKTAGAVTPNDFLSLASPEAAS